jgi:hypothetical protein
MKPFSYSKPLAIAKNASYPAFDQGAFRRGEGKNDTFSGGKSVIFQNAF